jgi:CPA2 family monovalent cation:H+ antiporter-2
VFEELKLTGKPFAPIVFGALIVEDLLAMLLLVLLTSIAMSHIAMSQNFEGGEIAFTLVKLVFFLILWVSVGIFLIPWILKQCKRLFNDELLLLISVGFCFVMVVTACSVGFSSALGAFVMGSILAETARGTQIERVMHPVKNLFAAIFFVSVGMRVDPAILIEYSGTVGIIVFLTVFIKFWGTGMGALLAGCSLNNAMRSGMCMAQIGEFAFIIAMLGNSLGVISHWLYPVVIAVSAVTTLTTPYLILSAEPVARFLDKWIPERVKLLSLRYEVTMNEQIGPESALSLLWRAHGLTIMLNTVIVIGIVLGVRLMYPGIHHELSYTSSLFLVISVLVLAPFLWGIFRGRSLRPEHYNAETLTRLQELQPGVSFVRFLLGSVLVIFCVGSFTDMPSVTGCLVAAGAIGILWTCGHLFARRLYHRIEKQFVASLTDKERSVVEDRSVRSHLVPWGATLTEYTLSEYSPLVMRTVQDSNLKRDFGVTVAIIRRGYNTIVAPKAHEHLLPQDRLYLIGTYEQLVAAQAVIESHPEETEWEFDDDRFGMVPFRIPAEHTFVGKTIHDCGIRETVNGLIVGVERGEQRFLSPHSNMVVESGDVIWIVGEKQLLAKLDLSHHTGGLSTLIPGAFFAGKSQK